MLNESRLIDETHERPRAARPGDRPEDRAAGSPLMAHSSLWDISDVSVYLRVSVHSVYKMTARKATVKIPHIRIGGKLRFRQADVDRWLTLLTVSNVEHLSRMRQKASQVTHAHYPQAEAP